MRARMHKTQQEQTGYREPVSLALFFFVFLASTFFFDERAALFFGPSLVSPLESLMLGSSAIGFIFRPYLCYRFPTRRHDVSTLMGTLAVAAILATLMARRAWVFLAGGIVLFMALGYIGNAAHSFLALRYAKTPHLARTVAISYASGIVLQFIFHMLVPGDIPNQVVLVAAALAMVTLLHAIAQTKAPDDTAWRDLFTMGTATPPRGQGGYPASHRGNLLPRGSFCSPQRRAHPIACFQRHRPWLVAASLPRDERPCRRHTFR